MQWLEILSARGQHQRSGAQQDVRAHACRAKVSMRGRSRGHPTASGCRTQQTMDQHHHQLLGWPQLTVRAPRLGAFYLGRDPSGSACTTARAGAAADAQLLPEHAQTSSPALGTPCSWGTGADATPATTARTAWSRLRSSGAALLR